mgnify:CR=1 FL=1
MAVVVGNRRPVPVRSLVALSGVLLLAWALSSWGTLWLPVLPAAVLPDLQRAGVGFVTWLGCGLISGAAIDRFRGRIRL